MGPPGLEPGTKGL